MDGERLSPELEDFFRSHRLQRAPRASTCDRIKHYILNDQGHPGETPDDRAEIVRQCQVEWINKRIDYADGLRTGRVLYIMPGPSDKPELRPRFEAMVQWDTTINGYSRRSISNVWVSHLRYLEPQP